MSEVLQRNAEEVEEIAAGLGLMCFLPEENEVFLDLDVEDAPEVMFGGVHQTLQDNGIRLTDQLRTKSKNGNSHLYFKCSRVLKQWERILIQTALGSDPVKEVLSMMRLWQVNTTAPVALFETKVQAIRVRQWRAKIKEVMEVAF